MRILTTVLLAVSWTSLAAGADTLDIRFIDVEGGQATLIVSPSGESILVDAGWPGFDGRDADRIAAAASKAGVSRIDYLIMTHYHTDHVGGVPQLAERIPIVNFVDHGQNTEAGRQRGEALDAAYYKVREKGNHIIVKPGDIIPIKGLKVQVVSARGKVIEDALPGAGASNPLCASVERKREDTGENGKSVGILVTHGKFRFVDLGDLTWNIELGLACPANKLGEVDVYLTSHHGLAASGPAAIVHALRPRVAILNNGVKKGGAPVAWQVVNNSPGLERFWQLHYTLAAGEANNAQDRYIANMVADGRGYGLNLSAQADGAFTLTNERTGYQETYAPRQP